MEAIEKLVKLHREHYHTPPEVIVSAPGRIDLLNTHQDYKGLPVIGVGINLRTYVALSGSSGLCRVYSENLRDMDFFRLDEVKLLNRKHFGNYVRAAVISLVNNNIKIPCFNATILSEVPIASGLASSAALLVSLITALLKLTGYTIDKGMISELAFLAENKIMGIPCGRLDQYSSAYGGFLLIRTRPPYGVDEIDFKKGVFVVIDSGIRHSTAEIHPQRQKELNEGIKSLLKLPIPQELRRKLGRDYFETRWDEISEEEMIGYINKIPSISMKRILYTIRAHRSTMLVVRMLKGERVSLEEIRSILKLDQIKLEKILDSKDPSLKLLGEVMKYQHELLSKLYDVSLPILDKLVEVSIRNGALGAKLSGAGLGGSIVALASDIKSARRILDSTLRAGAEKGWIVRIDGGVKIHEVR